MWKKDKMMNRKNIIVVLWISIIWISLLVGWHSSLAATLVKNSPTMIAPWIIEQVDQDKAVGEYVSLAIDQNDKTYISYYDGDNQNLRMASYVGTGGNCGQNFSWYCELVDTDGAVGKYTSIAVNPVNNEVAITYYDETNGALKYAVKHCNSTCTWNISTISKGAFGIKTGMYTSLKFDSNGKPRMTYYYSNPIGDDFLNYAHWVGTGGNCGIGDANEKWQCDNIDFGNGVGKYTSLGLTSTGDPRIAYYDSGKGDLKFAKPGGELLNCGPGNTWTCYEIDKSGDVGQYASMYIDTNHGDKPHIAYYDATNDMLKYAEYINVDEGNCGKINLSTGWLWLCDDIEELEVTGVPPVGISMTVDSDGNPIVAYKWGDGVVEPESPYIKIASPVVFLGRTIKNCGPGTSWYCAGIGTDPDSGDYTAVALNSTGLITVAYNDNEGDLLVAYQQLLPPQQVKLFLPLIFQE
jgi:hypothetical protein